MSYPDTGVRDFQAYRLNKKAGGDLVYSKNSRPRNKGHRVEMSAER